MSLDNQSLETLEAAAATEVELFECENLCSIHIQKEIFEYIKVVNCYEMSSEYSETYSLERFLKSLLKSNDRKLALMKFIQKVLLKERKDELKKSCSTELTLVEAAKYLEEIGLACQKYSRKEYLGCVSEILHI